MFMAATFSFVLYMLIFLRLRGNIIVENRRVSFRFNKISAWRGQQFEKQAMTIARQMLLYPVAYTILILPIAASRFSAFGGDDVPFEVTVFSAAVFLLSGIVNVTLFSTTRRLLPPDSFKVPKWTISQPTPIPELAGVDSYYQNSGIYAESIVDEKEQQQKYFSVSDTDYSTSEPLSIRTADLDLSPPNVLAPPPPEVNHHRDSRVDSVYAFYESTSAVPLTPADVAPSAR